MAWGEEAIADLMLGGGSFAVQDPNDPKKMLQLFGNTLGNAVPTVEARPKLSSSMQNILASAEEIANTMSPLQRQERAEADKRAASLQNAKATIEQLFGAPIDPQQRLRDLQLQQEEVARYTNPNRYQKIDINKVGPELVKAEIAQRSGALDKIGPIFESLGLTSTTQKAFDEAKAKAAGTLAGGGGKKTLSADLVRSTGTDDFDQRFAEAAASGSIEPQQQLALERLHEQKLKRQDVERGDRNALNRIDHSSQMIDGLAEAYKQTSAFKSGGAVSEVLKQALSFTAKGASAIELADIMKPLTPEDRRFVALYGRLAGNLRMFSTDERFSNFDSKQQIDALGNPIVGPELYLEQLKATQEDLADQRGLMVRSLKGSRKNTKAFEGKNAIPQGTVAVTSPQGKRGYIPQAQLQEAIASGYKQD